MEAWLVHAARAAQRCEVFELRFDAGVEQRGEPHLPGTEELVVCVSGVLVVGPLGEEEELRAGDAVWFAADVPHRYAAKRPARALDIVLHAADRGTRTP
jgi:quercetin dioxygenase-like cupin family protein